jgi:hypothetical protein
MFYRAGAVLSGHDLVTLGAARSDIRSALLGKRRSLGQALNRPNHQCTKASPGTGAMRSRRTRAHQILSRRRCEVLLVRRLGNRRLMARVQTNRILRFDGKRYLMRPRRRQRARRLAQRRLKTLA